MNIVAEGFSTHTSKIKAAVSAANEILIRHFKFKEAYNKVAEAIQFEPEDSIVAVIGPTGAGKTALGRYLRSEIDAHYKSIGLKPGQIPAVFLEAEAPESHRFQFRPLYMQWLAALKEPLLAQKSDLSRHLQYLRDNGFPLRVSDPAQQPLGLLRQLVIRALDARGTEVTLIDESQHMAKVSSGSLVHQMDLVKSISNQTRNTRLVLLGTGEMLDLLDQSAQLSRRVVVVELEPYGATIPDLKEFGRGIASLLEKGPIPHQISLQKKIVYIHCMSLGLFGVAANWIRRGWAYAMRLQEDYLTIEHLEATAFANRQLDRMRGEITICDNFFSADRRRSDSTAVPPKSPDKPKKPSSGKVGRRKLGRDQVGQLKTAA